MHTTISIEQPAVSWKLFVVTAVGIGILVGAATWFASYMSTSRNNAVINKYTTLGESFIQQNQKSIDMLFTVTMDECDKQIQSNKTNKTDMYYQATIPCDAVKNTLALLNTSNLSNYPSTAFLKYTAKRGYEFISIDGNYTQSNNLDGINQINWGDPKTDLQNYVMSNKKIKLWNDYIQYMTGKEVLVRIPSSDNSVQIMFRGVIE